MNGKAVRSRIVGWIIGAAVIAAVACGEEEGILDPGDDCLSGSGTTSHVRFHVSNFNDAEDVRVVLTVTGRSAQYVIDPVPTGGELGDCMFSAGVGTEVNVDATLENSQFLASCTVNDDAFDPNRIGNAGQVFIDLSANTQTMTITNVTCGFGLDPS